MAVESKLMTADELSWLPNASMRHELVNGELLTMAPPGAEHGSITSRIDRSLGPHVEASDLGAALAGDPGFQLTTGPDTVRAPDVAFIRRERVPESGLPRGYFPGAPDAAFEVISPNHLYTEVDEKVAGWLTHGKRLLVGVNPRRRAKASRPDQPVRTRPEVDVLDGEDVVPGWSLPVRNLFRK
jgi:Uma2 family endonuclease